MDIKELKNYIYENNFIEEVLVSIGCHHIKYHPSNKYWTCANKTGDNIKAVTIYNNEYLGCTNYTRSIKKGNRNPDILDLATYTLDVGFPIAIKHMCETIGLSYYHDFNEDIPECFRILKEMDSLLDGDEKNDDIPLKPISEKIISYYKPYVNDFFYHDGISYSTQQEFEIGYDECSNRITIPIRSELGDLIGIKGRIFKEEIDDNESKYLYLEPCNKSKILYGLHKTLPFIQKKGFVYIGEAEKFVLQLWSHGYFNTVSTGGSKISKNQVDLIIRAGGVPIFCYDKDIQKNDYEKIADLFPEGYPVFYMYDENNILNEKQAPSDDIKKWEHMVRNNIYKLR